MVDLKKMAALIDVKRSAIELENKLKEDTDRLQSKKRYSSYQEFLVDGLNIAYNEGAIESVSKYRKGLYEKCGCDKDFVEGETIYVFYQNGRFQHVKCLACGYWLESTGTIDVDWSRTINLNDYIDFTDLTNEEIDQKVNEAIEVIENIIVRLSQDVELIKEEELTSFIKEELNKDLPKVRKLDGQSEN